MAVTENPFDSHKKESVIHISLGTHHERGGLRLHQYKVIGQADRPLNPILLKDAASIGYEVSETSGPFLILRILSLWLDLYV